MNHIATGRALSLGGELLPPHHGSQLRDEDGGGVDGDDSGGNSPSRQGAETATFVPRIRVFDGGGATELFWRNRRFF